MIVQPKNQEYRIVLQRALDTRVKFLNLVYFLAFGGVSVFILLLTFESIVSTPHWSSLFVLAVIVVLGYAAFKFLDKALKTEKLILKHKTLAILRRGFLKSRKDVYNIEEISNFRHIDKPALTRHALAGETFDYLGFQTEQALINEMHGDNRLSFEYRGLTISFGENVYSWEFEKLEVLLYDITKNDFRYTDEFEKSFGLKN